MPSTFDTNTNTSSTNMNSDSDVGIAQQFHSSAQLAFNSVIYTSCHVTFQDGQKQRTHMKQPWHVYNVKRRIASLAPISEDIYETWIGETSAVHNDREVARSGGDDDETIPDDFTEGSLTPSQCLFCSLAFGNSETGLTDNLEHMCTTHGLFIPEAEMIIDMHTFVTYLATEVQIWHECLYCGATKSSTRGIHSHMRDKGHCLLNFDREPELLEFWDALSSVGDAHVRRTDQERLIRSSASEFLSASGQLISSKKAGLAIKRVRPRHIASTSRASFSPPDSPDTELPASSEPQSTPGRQLSRRNGLGIVGISAQQQQALVSAEKKAQRTEAVVRRAREWMYAKGANLQKYDQADTKMKMGKQNHKLQPR